VLLVGVRRDQAGVHRKAFTADQPFLDRPANDRLKHMAEGVTLPEASMAVLRERRVIRNLAVQAQPAEPAISEVQMDFIAEPPFRPDTETVAHQQHPDQQFRVNRRPPRRAVERRQPDPHLIQFDKPVDRPQHVIRRDVPIERKIVDKCWLIRLSPHHRSHSRFDDESESGQLQLLN